MRLNKRKGRMFKKVSHTGTFLEGCDHDCVYCFAKFLPWGSVNHANPRLVQTDMKQVLTVRNAYIFLNSCHDAFAECIPKEWIVAMIDWIYRQHTSNRFLVQTKNTPRLFNFLDELLSIKDRIVLGTTIETNRFEDYSTISKAPGPWQRSKDMTELKNSFNFPTMGSLEPMMDFDLDEYLRMITDFKPQYVEAGLDNYEHKHERPLPTPDKKKRKDLVVALEDAGIEVVIKDGFWRDE